MKKYFPLWTIPVLIAFAFATVWLRLNVVQTTYELNEANKTLHNLKLENEKLELKVAQLRSPRRLEAIAKQRFKLSPPTPEKLIQLKD
ncbi:MAG: cell division protein FtsL [Bdellovibrionales bacterium]|nr:cell division protein FtsL [Oligoflexia bacterium]